MLCARLRPACIVCCWLRVAARGFKLRRARYPRPRRDDPDGYDVMYVDAAFMGSFASRMSHSCTPNCEVGAPRSAATPVGHVLGATCSGANTGRWGLPMAAWPHRTRLPRPQPHPLN
jgi:hypothetical protein